MHEQKKHTSVCDIRIIINDVLLLLKNILATSDHELHTVLSTFDSLGYAFFVQHKLDTNNALVAFSVKYQSLERVGCMRKIINHASTQNLK